MRTDSRRGFHKAVNVDTNADVPELYYYADTLFNMGNYSVITSKAIAIIHIANWNKFKPQTMTSPDEMTMRDVQAEISVDEVRDGLRRIVKKSMDDELTCNDVEQFFKACMKAGYRKFDEILEDIDCKNLEVNDLRLMFLPFIHPRLAETMPDSLKPFEDIRLPASRNRVLRRVSHG